MSLEQTEKAKTPLAEASSQYLEELEERRNECCCGLHVQTGSLIIGIIGVLGALAVIGVSAYFLWFVQLGLAFLILLLYVGVIVAAHFKQPRLYIPFLVVNFILVMFYGFFYIVSLFLLLLDLLSSLGEEYDRYPTPEQMHQTTVRWFTFIQMLGILISLVVGMWFETIVYRAFRRMNEEKTGIPSSRTFHTLKQSSYHKRAPEFAV
ncbi:hypothetical protein M3Y99_00748100 [Aphelenchoides fujianensis]|nr:hypothetical protein M3Y99_01342000 [Aphelenchoides fujianensis]KAI6234850.1 hypothetical protein M3Y99_00748100 [Aphelenchoides fujianensis]